LSHSSILLIFLNAFSLPVGSEAMSGEQPFV
jgi:hypothetical protein